MKIICTQENLKNGLSVVSRVVGSSSTLPILNNIMLQTENGLLKVSGTNLEIGISTFVRCKVDMEGGICLGVKTFSDLVNSLGSDTITIDSSENDTVVSTERSKVKVKHLSTEDFPILPKIEDGGKVTIDAQEFKLALDQVVYAASISETQPEISGVLFWFGGENLLITATDRFRLAEKSIPYKGGVDYKVIVPHKSIQEISRLLSGLTGNIEINLTTTQLALSVGDTYVVTRLIDGQYPPYQQIIPETSNSTVQVQKSDLLAAIKTSSIFSSKSGSIVVNYDAEKSLLQINSVSQDLGESLVDIPCKITGDSGVLMINYRYLLDFLNNLQSDEVYIKIVDEASPILFSPEENSKYMYLVMPIRQ